MIGPSTDNLGGSPGFHVETTVLEDGRTRVRVPGTPIDLVGANGQQVMEEANRRINTFVMDGQKGSSSWASPTAK